MRPGIVGFYLGAIIAVLTLFLLQRIQLSPVAGEFSYHFQTCVFGENEFPDGDLDNGRMLRRALLPLQITKTFYNAQFREVREADKPGRYGAVVRIDTNAGAPVYRFITLYRTPKKIFWDSVFWNLSASIPPDFGLNPAVVQTQRSEIGQTLTSGVVDEDGNASAAFAVLLAGLSETQPGDPPSVQRTNAQSLDLAWWYELRQHMGLTPHYQFLVDLPRGYDDDPRKHWPLILFLHHAGVRGSDLNDVRTCGLAGLIAQGKQLPAIVVSPQCPANEPWSTPILSHLLDEMAAQYRVDPDRVYLTGISAGGDEAWIFALAQPDRFAAVIPISGDTDPADAARLKNLPIWAFHGMKDDIIWPGRTSGMIDAIRQAGGHPHLTLDPDAGHDVWDHAYAIDALYTWLFAQKRGQPEVLTPGVPSP